MHVAELSSSTLESLTVVVRIVILETGAVFIVINTVAINTVVV